MKNKLKILIVDDNLHNRIALRTVLKSLDAEIDEASNGFDALSMAFAQEYALILLDVQMPEMDGFEVCEQLRADPRTAETPVIFLTAAYKDVVDKVHGYVVGATDYLDKPIEDRILKAKAQIFLKLYEQHRLLHESNESLRIAASVFDSQEAMLVTDTHTKILRVNNAFLRMTGYLLEDVIGQTPKVYSTKRQNAQFYARMWQVLLSTMHWQGEVWNRRKNGDIFPCWLSISAVKNEQDEISHYIGTFSDLTSFNHTDEQIYNLAFYDPLTRLPNRRQLLDRIIQTLQPGYLSRYNAALWLINVNNFKQVNDKYGYESGDSLLIELAHRLQSIAREKDTLARLWGDEFAILLNDLDSKPESLAAQVQLFTDKLLNSLTEPYLLSNSSPECYPVSIGVTLLHKNQDSAEDVIKHATAALKQARTQPNQPVHFFDEMIEHAIQARSELDYVLRQSIENQQLQLYYQIQVNARKQPIGVEALLRWQHPDRGIVNAADFIPLAEDNGSIMQIGQWALEQACLQLRQWDKTEHLNNLSLSVNIGAKQFHQRDYVDNVHTALKKSGINPSRLKLELTENVILEDVNEAANKMRALRALGIKISINDFGTGYSSLTYLQRLPMDELKINQAVVVDLLSNENEAAMVKTIIVLAECLTMSVIASGVETEQQFELLKNNGCRGFQGYLFGYPLPLQEFEQAAQSLITNS